MYFFDPLKDFSKELFSLFSLIFNGSENFPHPSFSKFSFSLRAARDSGESKTKTAARSHDRGGATLGEGQHQGRGHRRPLNFYFQLKSCLINK